MQMDDAVSQHNIGVLRERVDDALRQYRGRREGDIRAWELRAVRERVDAVVAESPFAGRFRVLVGFNPAGEMEVLLWPNGNVASA